MGKDSPPFLVLAGIMQTLSFVNLEKIRMVQSWIYGLYGLHPVLVSLVVHILQKSKKIL
jgi:hypothetical protein